VNPIFIAGDQVVAGSNPVSPTQVKRLAELVGRIHCWEGVPLRLAAVSLR
jgi:hypothetical protein